MYSYKEINYGWNGKYTGRDETKKPFTCDVFPIGSDEWNKFFFKKNLTTCAFKDFTPQGQIARFFIECFQMIIRDKVDPVEVGKMILKIKELRGIFSDDTRNAMGVPPMEEDDEEDWEKDWKKIFPKRKNNE